MLILFACLLLPTLLVFYVLLKHNILRQLRCTWSIPGPTAYPLIGNGLMFFNKSAHGELFIAKTIKIKLECIADGEVDLPAIWS